MMIQSSSHSNRNEIVDYYDSLGTDKLISLYKKGELTEYVIFVIAEILRRRDIDVEKIDKVLIKPQRRHWKEMLLDSIGYVGFVFGIVAPIICALYESYIFLTKGKWPGYSTQDMLYFLKITKSPSAGYYIYFDGWPEISNLINHVVGFVMDLSLILTLGLLGFIIFELVDLLHTAFNKKRVSKFK